MTHQWTPTLRLEQRVPTRAAHPSPGAVSVQEIVDAFLELKDDLGRIPTRADMDELGAVPSAVAASRFGGWRRFLEYLDLPTGGRIPTDVLVREFLDLAQELGRIPNLPEVGRRCSFSARTYYNRFGCLANLVVRASSVGTLPGVALMPAFRRYRAVRGLLGRIPREAEARLEGCMHELETGELVAGYVTLVLAVEGIETEDVVADFRRLESDFRYWPLSPSELVERGRFPEWMYRSVLGSLQQLVERARERPDLLAQARDDSIRLRYQQARDALARVPSRREAGLERERALPIKDESATSKYAAFVMSEEGLSRENLILDFVRLEGECGAPLSWTQFVDGARWPEWLYLCEFGSFGALRGEAASVDLV